MFVKQLREESAVANRDTTVGCVAVWRATRYDSLSARGGLHLRKLALSWSWLNRKNVRIMQKTTMKRSLRGELLELKRCLSTVTFTEHRVDFDCCQDESNATIDVADLDGDGDVDIIVGFPYTGRIAWYENMDGHIDAGDEHVITDEVISFAHRLRAADLDGDGDLDIVAIVTGAGGVMVWYENIDGDGTFGNERLIERDADSIDVADIDGDGDIDVVTGSYNSDNVAWLENRDGHGSFRYKPISQAVDSPLSAFTGDLDGDGDADIISISNRDHKIAWYENTDGAGTFGQQRLITSTADEPRSGFVADIDDDGDLDVVAASYGNGTISWFVNSDGRGSFSQRFVIGTREHVWSIAPYDFNGDGKLDILSSSPAGIAWHQRTDTPGEFGPPQLIHSTIQISPIGAADLNGDGDLDVISVTNNALVWYENRVIGDSNDDGVFTTADLVKVFQAGLYEDEIPNNATFDEGDWNLDGEFDSGDLVFAFQAGTFTAAAKPVDIASAIDAVFEDLISAKHRSAFVP